MRRLLSIFSFKFLPWFLLLALLLAVIGHQLAVNSGAFWFHFYANSSPKLDDGLRFEGALRSVVDDRGVFVLGASQARENVDTHLLAKIFRGRGLSFYNLGISHAQALDFYMTIDRILDANPGYIVFISDLNMIGSPYMYSKLRLYFNHTAIPEIARQMGWSEIWKHRKDFWHAFLGELSPIYRFRESFGRIFKDDISVMLGLKERKGFRRFAYSKKMDRMEEDVMKDQIREEKKRRLASAEEVLMNEEMMNLCIRKIKERNIPLVVIDAPYYPGAKEGYFSELFHPYDAYMRLLSDEYGFLYFSESDMPVFDRGDFVDHTHLSKAGRRKFTEFLAEVIEGFQSASSF